ncbi:hypothetical protein [Sphingomonas glacialis]|uniref:Uncharacterized protein n=1 Tax=Sphingomonas glacialis TaxID=658225 RepID=A0A502FI45_9SPHN|nr:hypothetical protein [Sphingomonas glacialis]TPG49140.1 hypothetical protein EAH76_20240 [Sphingomonas glacialis]
MRIVLGVALGLAAASMSVAATAASADPLDPSSPAVVGRLLPVETKLAPDFRVRTDLLTTSASVNPIGDPNSPMQHRFASSMIDYYPLGGSGLRLSAGMRFFQVANFLKDAEKATAGLLYNPRLPGSGNAVRTGFNRHTPAATVGYTSSFKNALVGFEVGSLIGNANANLPRAMDRLSNRARGGMNPIANVVVGLRF